MTITITTIKNRRQKRCWQVNWLAFTEKERKKQKKSKIDDYGKDKFQAER